MDGTSWLRRESGLPNPALPEVGRIPKSPFDIEVSGLEQTRKPITYYDDLRPHAFYGKRVESGVLIYPGLLIAYIESSQGGSAVQTFYEPAGFTAGPQVVSAGDGAIICLKFDVDEFAITNVSVGIGTPQLFPATAGGACAVEIGTVTSNGFNQKLRSDFFYTSILPDDAP